MYMKKTKYVFASIVIFLNFVLPLFYKFFGASDALLMLSISLGLMLLLSILNYKESFDKIKGLTKLNIQFTRGLVYCLCSLPFLYKLMEKPIDYPFRNYQIVLYLSILILAIFNYGIAVKERIND